MNNLSTFSFESHALRITDHHGEPWFVLKDILASMGTSRHTTQAVTAIEQGLGDGYINDVPIPDALGRSQHTTIVAEPAATFLVSRSNTEQGRRLNRFIHTEVLPSIRRTGAFSIDPAPAPVPALTKTLDLGRYTELLEAENAILRERTARVPEAAAPAPRPAPRPVPQVGPRPVTPAETAEALRLFNAGVSRYAIAKQLGRNSRVIYRLIERATTQAAQVSA